MKPPTIESGTPFAGLGDLDGPSTLSGFTACVEKGLSSRPHYLGIDSAVRTVAGIEGDLPLTLE